MGQRFSCARCRNEDERYLGRKPSGEIYCRRCLPFCGREADPASFPIGAGDPPALELSYPLTEEQERISKEVLDLYRRGKPALIHAVTGAGKTELVYAAMAEAMKEGKRVGFATPRKDVVLEIEARIREAFPKAKVVGVCERHTSDLVGHAVVLTAHQLYRYPNFFDLLVFDEIDAFPYRGNPVLKSFFEKSVRGTFILLTATPSKEDEDEVVERGGKVLRLFCRYHGNDLPVPAFRRHLLFEFPHLAKDLSSLLKQGKQAFVFAPTIREGERLFEKLSWLFPSGECASSQDPLREEKIADFKKGKLRYLVTTSILERGVTVKNLAVLVSHADQVAIYDAPALVQIAGRAGRKKGYEKGEVFFYGAVKTSAIGEAIRWIEACNERKLLPGLL